MHNNLTSRIAATAILAITLTSATAQNTPTAAPHNTTAAAQNLIDPNARPVVFAPGVVSSPYEEVAATFTPDGNTVYFAQGTIALEICYSKKVNGEWTKPNIVSFSGRWGDWDPCMSADGQRIYFVSNRPLDTTGDNKFKRSSHLWYVDRLSADRWSD